jgi:hypothetical protein
MEKERVFESKLKHGVLPYIAPLGQFGVQCYIPFSRPVMEQSHVRDRELKCVCRNLDWSVIERRGLSSRTRVW